MHSFLSCALALALVVYSCSSCSASSARHLQNFKQGKHSASNNDFQHYFCPTQNAKLSAWVKNELQEELSVLPKTAKDFESFLVELKTVLDAKVLNQRPIDYIMSDNSPFHPTCSGDWMEFGVFEGATINTAAKARKTRCGDACPPVFGFDTFTGLPETWKRDENGIWEAGRFSLEGKLPQVEDNVELVKGVFADILPLFEAQHAQHSGNQTVSFLHIDCDLYTGSRDVLQILNDRIHPGTVLLFDELVNYNNYREGEVKALWEWLSETGAKLVTLGIAGPVEGKDYAMDINVNEPSGELPWFTQSVAFVVTHGPKRASAPSESKQNAEVDASLRDPVLLDAGSIEGSKDLGALGHFRGNNKRVPVERQDDLEDVEETRLSKSKRSSHRSRSTRDRQKGSGVEASNVESIIPLKELEIDPEGDVPQDASRIEPLSEEEATQELAADKAENLNHHSKSSSLDDDSLGLDSV